MNAPRTRRKTVFTVFKVMWMNTVEHGLVGERRNLADYAFTGDSSPTRMWVPRDWNLPRMFS
jgi:hypothetical protein